MPILYSEAKQILAKYNDAGGSCTTAPGVDMFVRQVLEYMLVSGEYGNLRKFTFQATKGIFTVPYELEVPIKVKINDCVGTSWDKWFEWHSGNELGSGCIPASNALYEDPNEYPTAYDMPPPGSQVGVLGICAEDDDAYVIVQGEDLNHRPVFTVHKGEQVSGEYLSIVKNEIRYTQSVFSKITGILKTKTNGYVQLLWVNSAMNLKGFLSDYSPLETKPSYRRYRITSRGCGNIVKVSVLARIRLKPAYADTDYIPFDSIYALSLAGQSINANFNNDVSTAQAKDTMMQNVITKNNEYKRVENGQPVEFFYGLSAGLIKNIV